MTKPDDSLPDPSFIHKHSPSRREFVPAAGEDIIIVSINDLWCAKIRVSRNGTPLKMAVEKLKQFTDKDDEIADLWPIL